MPSVASRPPILRALSPRRTRSSSTALSTSPSVSSSAFLQSIMPAPVLSRSSLTCLAEMVWVLTSLPLPWSRSSAAGAASVGFFGGGCGASWASRRARPRARPAPRLAVSAGAALRGRPRRPARRGPRRPASRGRLGGRLRGGSARRPRRRRLRLRGGGGLARPRRRRPPRARPRRAAVSRGDLGRVGGAAAAASASVDGTPAPARAGVARALAGVRVRRARAASGARRRRRRASPARRPPALRRRLGGARGPRPAGAPRSWTASATVALGRVARRGLAPA